MPTDCKLADQMKNDFQNAIKRNLHTWTNWRIKLNDQLVEAVLSGTEVRDVEPFDRYMCREVLDPDHPTTNPKTLMTYSAAENSSTNLRHRYFYKYGIPRAKLDPRRQEKIARRRFEAGGIAGRLTGEAAGSWDDVSMTIQPPADAEELVMDYFHYDDDHPLMSSAARLASSDWACDRLLLFAAGTGEEMKRKGAEGGEEGEYAIRAEALKKSELRRVQRRPIPADFTPAINGGIGGAPVGGSEGLKMSKTIQKLSDDVTSQRNLKKPLAVPQVDCTPKTSRKI